MLTGAFLFRAIACVKLATPVGAPAAAAGAPRRLEPDQKPVEKTRTYLKMLEPLRMSFHNRAHAAADG